MLRKLSVICQTAKALFRGDAIIIMDEGKVCNTFVGENISRTRFKRVLLSHLSSSLGGF